MDLEVCSSPHGVCLWSQGVWRARWGREGGGRGEEGSGGGGEDRLVRAET